MPPWNFLIISDTEESFDAIGVAHLNNLKDNLHLKKHENVLEIGSGNGRIACALSTYLTDGNYVGVDVMKPFTQWCNKTYNQYSNFSFKHINVYNKKYNPDGKLSDVDYIFDFQDDSLDLIYLTSVFTHMLHLGVENYIKEIYRMLKPGGRCMITYFLINEETKTLMNKGKYGLKFVEYAHPTYSTNLIIPEVAVAYDEQYIIDLYAAAGFDITKIEVSYGTWRDAPNANKIGFWQDRIAIYK